MLATQGEPMGMRQVFPCFDEPVYKAVFNISVIHYSPLQATSNMMEFPATNLGYKFTSNDFKIMIYSSFTLLNY